MFQRHGERDRVVEQIHMRLISFVFIHCIFVYPTFPLLLVPKFLPLHTRDASKRWEEINVARLCLSSVKSKVGDLWRLHSLVSCQLCVLWHLLKPIQIMGCAAQIIRGAMFTVVEIFLDVLPLTWLNRTWKSHCILSLKINCLIRSSKKWI